MATLTAPDPRPQAAGPLRPDPGARLLLAMPRDRLRGWVTSLLVTTIAGLLHFWRLGSPRTDIFDEVYYHWEALGLMRYGVEQEKASILSHTPTADFVVHPPLGKWLIAGGIQLFGNTPFGWRFASAVAGTLAVLVLTRVARRMFRSTLLGCLAGLLFTLDGMEFVQSRTAMLDIFYLLFVVVSLACLVLDREQGRRRLAARLGAGAGHDQFPGPRLGIRWWRLATGFFLGCLCAVKWDGVYLLPMYGALAFAWDVGARRTAGVPAPVRAALRRDWLWWLPSYLLVPTAVYTASWTGWFLASDQVAYDRHYHGRSGFLGTLLNWAQYHREAFKFHTNLTNVAHCLGGKLDAAGTACLNGIGTFYAATHHPYESKPFGWLVLARPVAYYYTSPKFGQHGCTAPGGCAREVLLIGTPAIWWVGTVALLVVAGLWAARRDWRAGMVALLFSVNFFPWLATETRVMFAFYILPGLPFLVLGLAMVAGLLLKPGRLQGLRAAVVGVYVLTVLANFAQLYPVLTGQPISMASWHARIWFPGWV